MISFKVLTLFPELFPGPLAASITGSALEKKLWEIEAVNLRNYSKDARKTVDDMPYGGGAGMVLKADVVADAIQNNKSEVTRVIYLSPRGQKFNQKMARELSKEKEILFLCGRYEGVDQRALDAMEVEEISIGDYVLSGGEMAAFVAMDAILRNVEGVLGADESLAEESFGSSQNSEFDNLLEYPHFTRPAEWNGRQVPDVLTSGHHKKITEWRKEKAIEITKKNRPDIYEKFLKESK